MLTKKMKITSLIVTACAFCLFVTELSFAQVKKGCLTPFCTRPEIMAYLSKEKSRIAYYYQPDGYGESNIFSIRPDGTDIIQHTNANDDLPYKYDPAWSPDGTMLAFEAASDTNDFNIIISSATSELTYPDNMLKNLDTGYDEFYPTFSPDGTKIAAIMHGAGGNDEIIIFDIATENWESLGEVGEDSTLMASGGAAMSPKWSPNSDKIVYSSYKDYQNLVHDIYVIDVETKVKTNLTNSTSSSDNYPCWSPDGQYIVYSSRPDGSDFRELYVMNNDGSDKLALTQWDLTNFYSPSFSPDGKMVVTSLHDTEYYYGLYIIKIVGEYFYFSIKGENTLYFEDSPAWSSEFEPPSVDLAFAYPLYVEAGASTSLFWRTSNTYSCKIENDVGEDVGSVDANGIIDVTPASTTTYTIKAYGLAGSVAKQKVKIIVE